MPTLDLHFSLYLLRQINICESCVLSVWFHRVFFAPSWYVILALTMYLWVVIFWAWIWQEGSDSERESNDAPGSRKPVKRKREKVQLSISKDQSHSIASSDDCLSILKKRRFDGKVPIVVPLPLFFPHPESHVLACLSTNCFYSPCMT